MDESTTKQLEDIPANVNTTKQTEKFMELPKAADSFQSFPAYFESPEAVQGPGRDKVLRLCLAAGVIDTNLLPDKYGEEPLA